jgi:hypothetical protein
MRYVTAAVLVFVLSGPAAAQIQVDIGIHLPGPPRLVVVPQLPAIQYAPVGDINLFFYNSQYWVFVNGGWYVSHGYQGPWIVVGPQFVPRPLLLVPVRYYHVPPGHWRSWKHDAPPRWGNEWGHEWASKRGWKDRDDDRGRGPHGKGRGDDRQWSKKEGKDRHEDRDRGRGKGRDDGRDKKSQREARGRDDHRGRDHDTGRGEERSKGKGGGQDRDRGDGRGR